MGLWSPNGSSGSLLETAKVGVGKRNHFMYYTDTSLAYKVMQMHPWSLHGNTGNCAATRGTSLHLGGSQEVKPWAIWHLSFLLSRNCSNSTNPVETWAVPKAQYEDDVCIMAFSAASPALSSPVAAGALGTCKNMEDTKDTFLFPSINLTKMLVTTMSVKIPRTS